MHPLQLVVAGRRELKQRTSAVLRRVRERGEEVEVTLRGRVIARLVPALMPPEVAGALARRLRNGRLARRAVQYLLRLPTLRLVSLDRRLAEDAVGLAADLRLCGADATYVAVARRLRLPLVTWDREQRDRARRAVTTVGATRA
jgi:prevent-host-death family protein